MKMIRPKNHAFSLTEVLVVIGIIAVLVVLAVPTLESIKKRQQSAQCVGTLKLWSSILYNYATENGGVNRNWYSGSRDHPDPAQYWTYYMRWKNGYSDTEIRRRRCPLEVIPPNNTNLGVHYGFYVGDPEGKVVDNPGGKEYQINLLNHPRPSSAFFLADCLNGNSMQGGHTIFPDRHAERGGFHTRHGDRANVSFLDGHIESMSAEDFYMREVKRTYNSKNELISR